MSMIVETTWWTAVACAVWLATLSTVTLPELCFAVAASVPCGILARASRRALGATWRFDPRWLLWAWPVICSILAEFPRLLVAATTHRRSGHLTEVDLPDEDAARAAGREGAAILAICSTPGDLVLDSDPGRRRLVLHVLVSGGPDVEEAVRR